MTSRSGRSSTSAEARLAEVHRAEWARLLAALVARTRRLDLAEDAMAEAFARAAARWPVDGVPDNPEGWLYTTAHRQAVGRIRAESIAGRKAPLLAVRGDTTPSHRTALDELGDERLDLILLCCHPALPLESRSALALRLVMGTSTDQIARLFLVSTPTMAARLTRAKRKIVQAGIPLRRPAGEELTRRLDEVCRTIYLAFTAGYTPGSGPDLVRADTSGEAVELAGLLTVLAPGVDAPCALRSLLLLQHSRRDTRVQDGALVRLAEQDRSRWHHDEIELGLTLLRAIRPTSGYAEELRLQASIAAEHVRSPDPAHTDWAAIAALYAELDALTGSPVVRLNRAVAVAEADGPAAGLELLASVAGTLDDNHRFHAVRGELARRAGDLTLAESSLAAAVELCDNDVERQHLNAQLDGLRA